MIESKREAPPLSRLKVPECLLSNKSPRGPYIFFISNRLGSFFSMRARHTKDFFRTLGEVLLDRAISKMVSAIPLKAWGIIVAIRERARDCAASFFDLISDSIE